MREAYPAVSGCIRLGIVNVTGRGDAKPKREIAKRQAWAGGCWRGERVHGRVARATVREVFRARGNIFL